MWNEKYFRGKNTFISPCFPMLAQADTDTRHKVLRPRKKQLAKWINAIKIEWPRSWKTDCEALRFSYSPRCIDHFSYLSFDFFSIFFWGKRAQKSRRNSEQ